MTGNDRCSPLDLVNFLPYACYQLQAPFSVVVFTRILEEYVNLGDKAKKTKIEKSTAIVGSQVQISAAETKENLVNVNTCGDDDTVVATVVLDAQGRVIALDLINTIVPPYFLQILDLCIPFHLKFNKMTLRSCPVSDKTIYELSRILSKSHISEICLDKTPLAHCNCAALLQHPTHLKYLSLNGCGLTDEDCEDMAVWLQHRRLSCRLRLLSMASNFIQDRGALALANMLRSNRHLRYINISDNQITDTGVLAMFNSLIQFPLTQNEIHSKRLHNFEYLKLYRDAYAKFYQEAISLYSEKVFDDRTGVRRKTVGKRSNVSIAVSSGQNIAADIVMAASVATVDAIGPNEDPFSASDTLYQNGHLYSVGNTSLAYINISHNHISILSVLKLIEVLRYQDNFKAGLVRVMLEGNPLPANSPHLVQLAELQRRAIARVGLGGIGKADRRSTRKH